MDTYHTLINNMPPGLSSAILRTLSMHTGAEQAIGRDDLLEELARVGYRMHERIVRETIRALRRNGHLICSMPGEGGGYYMPSSLAEYRNFRQKEFLSKITDMTQTMSLMDKTAKVAFGDAEQVRLF